jgi:hypothetical protein
MKAISRMSEPLKDEVNFLMAILPSLTTFENVPPPMTFGAALIAFSVALVDLLIVLYLLFVF